MPIYEYVCQDCGTLFEILRPIKEADLPIQCQNCDSINTVRQLSLFFAKSGGKVIAGNVNTCSGCSGGSCSTCSK